MASETVTSVVSSQNDRLKIFLHALLFVAGFSLVFIVGWGGSVTVLGQLFGTYKRVIAQIGGVVVIMFGLATLEVDSHPLVLCRYACTISGQRGTYGGSALMGIFFAAGWSPCIGATLGAILTMGLSQQTVGQAMWLASGYSLGLGIPFLVMAIGLERASGWVKGHATLSKVFQDCQRRLHHLHRHVAADKHDEPDLHLGIQEWLFYRIIYKICRHANLYHCDRCRFAIFCFALCSSACSCLSRLFKRTYFSESINHEKHSLRYTCSDTSGRLPIQNYNG